MRGTTVSDREKKKSNQFGDANFMAHQLKRIFMALFGENKTGELLSAHCGGFYLSGPLHGPVWNQSLMWWRPLYACSCPHWGNEAESVCCSGWLCVPFITVTSQKRTKRKRPGGLLESFACPICPVLGFTTTSPTWRAPHPVSIHLHICLLGIDSLCTGWLRLPRCGSAPLSEAWVELLNRQWWEIQEGQYLTREQPTHAPALSHSPLCLCGLFVNLLKATVSFNILPHSL